MGLAKGAGRMILHLYFARRFALVFTYVLGGFLVLVILLDFIEQLRRFRGMEITLSQKAHLVALNVPATLYQMLPLVTVLCSIMLFLNLARSSELVVTRAAGRSALRALYGPILTSLLIGLIAIAIINPIVAGTQKKYEQLLSSFFFITGQRRLCFKHRALVAPGRRAGANGHTCQTQQFGWHALV